MTKALEFIRGVWTGLCWSFLAVMVGMALQVPVSEPPGTVDLHDFAALGMLAACGRMASRRPKVVEVRTIRLDRFGREYVEAEFEEPA